MRNSSYDVEFVLPGNAQTGQAVLLQFRTSLDGKPVTLEETQRSLHVILSSENRRDHFHTFAVANAGEGIYALPYTFTQSGKYRMWAEVDNAASLKRHDENADLITYTDFTVTGTGSEASAGTGTFVRERRVRIDGYEVRLIAPELRSGSASTLNVEVHDAKGNLLPTEPVDFTTPFVDPAIYIMVGPGLQYFRHGHPEHGPSALEKGVRATFPTPGEYLFWIEFYGFDGKETRIFSVPFLLRVS